MKFICPDTQSFDVLECSNIVVRVASVVGISCCETAKVAGSRVSETIMNLKRRTTTSSPEDIRAQPSRTMQTAICGRWKLDLLTRWSA